MLHIIDRNPKPGTRNIADKSKYPSHRTTYCIIIFLDTQYMFFYIAQRFFPVDFTPPAAEEVSRA
jgi:hypothetical protein